MRFQDKSFILLYAPNVFKNSCDLVDKTDHPVFRCKTPNGIFFAISLPSKSFFFTPTQKTFSSRSVRAALGGYRSAREYLCATTTTRRPSSALRHDARKAAPAEVHKRRVHVGRRRRRGLEDGVRTHTRARTYTRVTHCVTARCTCVCVYAVPWIRLDDVTTSSKSFRFRITDTSRLRRRVLHEAAAHPSAANATPVRDILLVCHRATYCRVALRTHNTVYALRIIVPDSRAFLETIFSACPPHSPSQDRRERVRNRMGGGGW